MMTKDKLRQLTGDERLGQMRESEYLGAEDIDDGTEPVLTIAGLWYGSVTLQRGKENKDVLSFKEERVPGILQVRPLIVNSTNRKTLRKLFGDAKASTLVGKQIQLYVDHNVRDPQDGGMTDGIRIRPYKPRVQKQEPVPPCTDCGNPIEAAMGKNAHWLAAYRCILDGYYAAVVSKGLRLKEKVMNITIASKLMELYAACPKCGCEVIGNGKGLLECDTAAGFFKRSCGCGWHVEVMEGITEGSLTEDPPELPAEDEDEPEPVIFADPEPESAPEPIFEPEPVLEPEKIRPWNGFVHIRCEACHKESTTCLRTPTDTYICKECGHEMPLPKAYRAYTRCECGQKGTYLTNVTDWAFDIPCVRCGAPNTVTYNPGRDCYGPVGSTHRKTKPRKKK